MAATTEIALPKSPADVILPWVITTIVVFFVIVAIVNVLNGIAIIVSSIWLAFVTVMVFIACWDQGGFRVFLINFLGMLAGRRFVETTSPDVQPGELRFGYELLGHRFIQRRFSLDRVRRVEWSPGQATSLAGRDMKDWSVCVRFHHGDAVKGLKQQRLRQPDQRVYYVGSARRKEDTESLGLLFIDLLRASGVTLVQGATDNCYVVTISPPRPSDG